MFKITETFKKDDNALNLVDLLNKYIKSVLIIETSIVLGGKHEKGYPDYCSYKLGFNSCH